MGSSRRHQRSTKNNAPQLRSRTTRSKGKAVVSDPTQSTADLTSQLRSLGLYAANTLGDGNCLFRALSDQLYGTPTHHLQLRADICKWIEQHREQYEPFVEDERGLDVHLRCMREQGTYGGHLELSAFAHFSKRNVKVIQPGLVYIIEWEAGAPSVAMDAHEDDEGSEGEGAGVEDARDRRKMRRERMREAKDRKRAEEEVAMGLGQDDAPPNIYVAYHDWEHFSSIRNLAGPHTGIPNVRETPAPPTISPPTPVLPSKPASRAGSSKPSPSKPKSKGAAGRADPDMLAPTPATQIPLPSSRSPSASTSRSPSPSSLSPSSLPNAVPAHMSSAGLRTHRSPKRTFDESESGSAESVSVSEEREREAEEEAARGMYKRTRTHTLDDGTRPRTRAAGADKSADEYDEIDVDVEAASDASSELSDEDEDGDAEDEDEDDGDGTPSLSAPSSGSASAASSPSPLPTPPPSQGESIGIELEMDTQTLTRRQRKRLGLPKHGTGGSGKIVIPGGRMVRGGQVEAKGAGGAGVGVGAGPGAGEGDAGEWKTNGTGRMDVRGFRELKI